MRSNTKKGGHPIRRFGIVGVLLACAITSCKPDITPSKVMPVKPPNVTARHDTPAIPSAGSELAHHDLPKLPELATGAVHSVLFTPDGRRLVFDTGAGVATIDLTQGRLLWYREAVSFTESLLMTEDGQRIVVPTSDPDKDTPTLVMTIDGRITARLPDVGPDSGDVISLDLVGHYLVRRAFTWNDEPSGDQFITEVWNIRTGRQTDRRKSKVIAENNMPLWQYIGHWRATGHPIPAVSANGKLVDDLPSAANNPLLMAGKYPVAAWWSKTAGPRQGDRLTLRSGRYFICLRDYMPKSPAWKYGTCLRRSDSGVPNT